MTNERRGELKAPILDYFKDINFHTNNCMAYESLNSMLDSLIEALEERPSGKWKELGLGLISNTYECPFCGRLINCDRPRVKLYPFCHCGAKLDGYEEVEAE